MAPKVHVVNGKICLKENCKVQDVLILNSGGILPQTGFPPKIAVNAGKFSIWAK